MSWSTSTLLRPVHAWFFVWEDVLPSLYRVVAVVTGAALTTVALRVFAVGPTWLVAIVTTLAWIGLGVAQEHDERVRAPVDQGFVDALRSHLDPLVGQHGLAFEGANGGCRARSENATTVRYDGAGDDQTVWIVRDPTARRLDIRFGSDDVATVLTRRGQSDLADRIGRATEPAADALAVRDALAIMLAP